MPQDTPFDQFFRARFDAFLTPRCSRSHSGFLAYGRSFFRGFLYPVLARRIGSSGGIILIPVYITYRPALCPDPHVALLLAFGCAVLSSVLGKLEFCSTAVRAVTKSLLNFLAVGDNVHCSWCWPPVHRCFRHMEKTGLFIILPRGCGLIVCGGHSCPGMPAIVETCRI